jgi:hypothetical protein
MPNGYINIKKVWLILDVPARKQNHPQNTYPAVYQTFLPADNLSSGTIFSFKKAN